MKYTEILQYHQNCIEAIMEGQSKLIVEQQLAIDGLEYTIDKMQQKINSQYTQEDIDEALFEQRMGRDL